ncbi:hypothetical protein [Nocardioides sp. W7]|uniref:hypothetical protein n=1 Tax=Nocardioides sp. W7 TaxID=2931390 RepID=UPI001FD3F582|nr:hypothetical protein [Nocardioides sp. W7]
MSEPTTTARPDVEAFVAQVRARLADLGEDEREELLDGLEADLSDQLADGSTDLGDPWLYAAELRAAAGLPEAGRARRAGHLLPRAADVEHALDQARERWSDLLGRFPAQVGEVLAALRPAWWVARAWVAVTLLDQSTGPWERISMVPSFAVTGLGLVLLLAAVTVSTLLGLGRLWPGSGPARTLGARLVLIGLNSVAVVVLLTFSFSSGTYFSSSSTPWGEGVYRGEPVHPRDGLRLDGTPVRNVFAFDAQGRQLTGVQLFRANGDPLQVTPRATISRERGSRTVGCGWLNGSTQLFNVFPLPQREQRRGTCAGIAPEGAGPVTEAVPPFAQVPPVTSPTTVPATTPMTTPGAERGTVGDLDPTR